MTRTQSIPIACTLTAADHDARLRLIADLNREALKAHERRDLRLELAYARKAGERLRELVRMEQECCAFLHFELAEAGNEIRLTITAPERAREAADTLFGQFLPAATANAGCACCRA